MKRIKFKVKKENNENRSMQRQKSENQHFNKFNWIISLIGISSFYFTHSSIQPIPNTLTMQLVKRSQLINIKSQDFREQYTSQNTSRPSNTSRLHQHKQKRFKRNKPNNTNHSKSSSNCSESNSISKFYVKNIASLIPAAFIQNQNSAKNIQSKETQRKQPKSPRPNTKNVLNAYGLTRQTNNRSPIRERKQDKKNDSSIDISNFLRRQFSPPTIQKNQIQPRKNIKSGINVIQDTYNFLSPTSKRTYANVQDTRNGKDPKSLLQQLAKQRNKNAQINLELQKCKNNQKKLNLLNQQLDLKFKRLTEKILSVEQQLSKSSMNNAKLKQENHRMKVLVKQRDSLMTTLMQKDRAAVSMEKDGSQGKSPRQHNESLVSKIIEYEYENQKLRDTIYKLKKQIQQHQYQPTSSHIINHSPLTPSQQPSMISSQITWDDRQFTDCLQQKDKQIIQLREEIKNLQIEINYINRKWINEVERVKKIDKLQWMKLKDKYKDLLHKYKDNMKMNIVMPPCREEVNRMRKDRKKVQSSVRNQQNHDFNPESPRKRKRNYTIQHLKGRGVMSDIRINYGITKTGRPSDDTADIELLEYSSCDEDFGL